MIAASIEDFINTLPAIANALARYDFGAGPVAAIFTTEIPTDAQRPLVFIEEVSNSQWDVRAYPGSETIVNIWVYEDPARSEKRRRDLAWALFYAIQHAELIIPDHQNWGVHATAPERRTDPDGTAAYVVPVLVRTLKTS